MKLDSQLVLYQEYSQTYQREQEKQNILDGGCSRRSYFNFARARIGNGQDLPGASGRGDSKEGKRA